MPARMDRLSEDSPNVSLDFVDANHLLLTFNNKKMFRRLPGCPLSHQDRLMHAAILDVHSGHVVNEADWYLHDRRPYLWPMGQGKFLLRRENDLYVVDSSLHEKLLLSSPKDLLSVAVTPDGWQIILETAKDASRAPASPTSTAEPEPKFEARFLNVDTLTPRRVLSLKEAVNLTGTSEGYVDLVHKGNIWLVRFGPSADRRHNIARVRSQTVPDVFYPSENSLVIGRCPSPNCDYSVSAFSLTGRRLWQQHWPRYRLHPSIARNEDNSRFAVSTLRVIPLTATNSANPPDDDDADVLHPDVSQRDVFEQLIQVFETASGTPLLSVHASPAVMTGQNFSLSPDGRRLALLAGSSVELFDLPPISSEEQAKSSALKTDLTPDLFSVNSAPTATTTDTGEETNQAASALSAETSDNSSSADDVEDANAQPPSADEQRSPGAASPPAISEQEVASKAGAITTFKVSSRAVVIDVVATDGKGHPVRGLGQQNFQLLEDGKPQDVHSFREFTDRDAAAPTNSSPVRSESRPNVFTNETHTPDPGAVTLILLDLLNTSPQDQEYARQQLIKFLGSKPKTAQFALCTLSAGTSHLRLLQGFTQDETVLLAAARGKKSLPQAVGWQSSATQTQNSVSIVGDLAHEGRSSGFQNLLGALQGMQAEQLGTDTDARVAITMDSLMQLARYLSGIPGRKNVVWLSGSFPVSIAVVPSANNSAAGNRNYSEKIKRVTNLLAESQIAVYPVHLAGLLAGGPAADTRGFSVGPPSEQAPVSSAILAPTPDPPQGLGELDQQAGEQESLMQVATATGGKAFFNTNGIREAIATAVEQGSNYYSLSYTPTNKTYNGRFRKIKVLLSEKGYTLHYRRGYFADDANSAARDADLVRHARVAAMQHGSPLSRQILFSARVAPAGPKTKMNHHQIGEVLPESVKKPTLPPVVEVQHYEIDYSFEGSQLRFIAQNDATMRSVLTLMAASFDSEGTMLTEISHVGISNLDSAVYKDVIRGEFKLHQEVDLPVQAVSLRLGIQDQMTNHLGTIEIPLPVQPSPDTPRRVRVRLPPIEPD